MSSQACVKKGSVWTRLRKALPELVLLKPFLAHFIQTTRVVTDITEILKNKGMTQASYAQCTQLCATLPAASTIADQVNQWLQQHLDIQQKFPDSTLLVSSDIIESLFGNYTQRNSRYRFYGLKIVINPTPEKRCDLIYFVFKKIRNRLSKFVGGRKKDIISYLLIHDLPHPFYRI